MSLVVQGLGRHAKRYAFGSAAIALHSSAASAAAPLSYLQSFGPKADSILGLTLWMLAVSIVVTVVMTALVLWAIFRRRTPEETQNVEGVHPESRPVNNWRVFGLGLTLTVLVLIGSVVWTMVTLAAIDRPGTEPALSIEVTGQQWWWKVQYLSDKPSQVFDTANEIHIPTGEPVKVALRSQDVIHSFWVPALSGKTDLIPGQVNTTWIEAKEPGVYIGQCTEYCGLQHAHMALRVVAEPPDKFEAWRNEQLKSAEPPKTDDVKAGLVVFERRCGACHTVRGTTAGGAYGPDLSHLMTRATLADGTIPNAGGYLAGWIADPQHVKPGTRMPRVALSGQELQAVTAYLRTLH